MRLLSKLKVWMYGPPRKPTPKERALEAQLLDAIHALSELADRMPPGEACRTVNVMVMDLYGVLENLLEDGRGYVAFQAGTH